MSNTIQESSHERKAAGRYCRQMKKRTYLECIDETARIARSRPDRQNARRSFRDVPGGRAHDLAGRASMGQILAQCSILQALIYASGLPIDYLGHTFISLL